MKRYNAHTEWIIEHEDGAWVRYADAQAEIKMLKAKLSNALERMDRARNILTNGNPTPNNNWGMLDTFDLRETGL